MSSVWRSPPEESIDFYPGLVVSDNRVTGSITCGRSRLPLWVFPETDPDAVAMPPPWWEQAEDRERVVAQLRRCIDVLESSE